MSTVWYRMRSALRCTASGLLLGALVALRTAAGAATPPPDGMIWIPGGTFAMGSEQGRADERPVHQVSVSGFWMDRTEVTNADFGRFVASTGYMTIAERQPDARAFPGVPPDRLVPGALVFTAPRDAHAAGEPAGWRYQAGAQWRHPLGPDSSIAGQEHCPVVQVSWFDAVAYATWAGKRLPSEAEFEYAARGGRVGARYTWGDAAPGAGGLWQANIWQGHFPLDDTGADGFRGVAPVASFPANGFGLCDMSGNVWEWCFDWYRPDAYAHSALRDPLGPLDSCDPDEPGVPERVQRGGSYLCCEDGCRGYLPASRMKCSPDTGLCNTGFRCVMPPVGSSP
jgi:formylglycine-generating enzyme required for sulfatase activity